MSFLIFKLFLFVLYRLSQLILRNSESKIYPFGIMCLKSDVSIFFFILRFFMTTVLFSAQRVYTQSLSPLFPLGKLFP